MARFRVALVSMPWPLANRPSVQLGALKGFIMTKAKGVQVDCFHPYVEVAGLLGLHEYNVIAERTWTAEAVYAYLLNPGKRSELLDLVRQEQRRTTREPPLDLEKIAAEIHLLHQSKHFKLPWSSYDLIGLSISLSQLTSSLYLIRQLRLQHPQCRTVVGGSSCAGELGHSLLSHVPQIDFVISGEGELPLLELIRRLMQNDLGMEQDCPGLLWRDTSGQVRGGGFSQLEDLLELPVPDYRDYFRELNRQPRLRNLIPALQVETSRGCWWHRARPGSVGRACRFCNLNLQWQGYRSKTALQVGHEMDELAKRHASLKFFFVDNILDPSVIDEMFARIIGLGRDFEIFTELRATISRQQLLQMRRAGVTQVQIGVEALSSRLLKKLNKGTTVIQNIQAMKQCEELGIQHHSNLILGFPRSDAEDVAETLENLKFVMSYQPLRKVRFWLGQNSPVALSPERHGIRRIANHPNYQLLLPESLATSLCLMIKTYVGDRTRQQRLWSPVARQMRRWQREYQARRQQQLWAPLLSYRDGGDFLLIRRRGDGQEHETFRLRGVSRELYLFCETARSLAEIQCTFPNFPLDQLENFISDLRNKRLMFRERDQILSLAISENQYRLPNSGMVFP
jgi:ribosomal peptide maturation radical SAM protein 1